MAAAGRHSGTLFVHVEHHRGGGGGHRAAEADAEQHQAGQLGSGGGLVGQGQAEQSGAAEQQGGAHHPVLAPARHQPAGQRPDHQRGQRDRQDEQAGLQRRQALHQLQVLAEHQLHADQRHGRHQGHRDAAGEAPVAEQCEVDHRLAGAALATDEQVQAEHAAERGQDGQSEVRGARAEFLDRIDHPDQAEHHLQRAEGVPWSP